MIGSDLIFFIQKTEEIEFLKFNRYPTVLRAPN